MVQLFDRDDSVEIGEIEIQRTAQSLGIGTRVLQDIIADAHHRNKRVVLSVGLGNHRALQLYERLGFHRIAQSETHHHMACAPPRVKVFPTDDSIVAAARARAHAMRSRLRALVASPDPPAGAAWREFGSAIGIRKPGKPGLARLMAASADALPQLDDAIAWMDGIEGADVTFEVPPIDANQPLREALAHRGFFPRRFQAMLACEPRISDLRLPEGIAVRAPRADEMAAYMRTFMDGFRQPDQNWSDTEREYFEREMVQEFGDQICWRLLLATVDGRHAGIGTLWFDGSTAFFSNGATIPALRGRGVHGALIRARLAEAARAGADIAYVDTNVSSAAERNLHRHGFRLVCHLGMWSRLPKSA